MDIGDEIRQLKINKDNPVNTGFDLYCDEDVHLVSSMFLLFLFLVKLNNIFHLLIFCTIDIALGRELYLFLFLL